ncbi:MAG: histone deacetylase family protein [Deltaproteobacteria bacterium]|nr:histone deacetylase family protein [Deltaproteobacteria bacterium]
MKVFFHERFHDVYTSDPAAAPGRMAAVVAALQGRVEFVAAEPAEERDILAVHEPAHVEEVKSEGLYEIAALAAGGAVQAAESGLAEPSFALIRPPGHHASAGSAWGFCYFNNMAIAVDRLRRKGAIANAFVLDFDLHFGDGTVNILGGKGYVTIFNPSSADPREYVASVEARLASGAWDIIGVSAGFDHHVADWGGLLATEDYRTMGLLVRRAAIRSKGGCFAILEGGYNHRVLGENVLAFVEGMDAG